MVNIRLKGPNGGTSLPPVGKALQVDELSWLCNFAGCHRYVPLSVTKSCPRGRPAVHLAFHDADGKTTVGSLFWLHCPQLLKAVFTLESEGLIDQFMQRIDNCSSTKAKHKALGNHYRDLRQQILSWTGLRDPRPESFVGVGGVGQVQGVKCLHSHLAFFLSTEDGWIGEELLTLLRERNLAPCWFDEDQSGPDGCELVGNGTGGCGKDCA